jgi:methylenetetrahydrofolate reductase (NADPH)
MESFRNNDEEAKAYGVQLCVEMCRELLREGVPCLHFYTLNLEKSVLVALSALGIGEKASSRREVPWRGPREGSSGSEAVRPIHWANRYKSYIDRTNAWDEFPNGR